MTRATSGRTGVTRLLRPLLVSTAVVVVFVPVLVGLVLAWGVHPLVVLPAYLLGIPVWLTLLSGAWTLVRRLMPGHGVEPPNDPITTELRLPAPRRAAPTTAPTREGSRLRTPTP